MAAKRERRSKYLHLRCEADLRETVEKYAKANQRTLASEAEFALRAYYELPQVAKLKLPASYERILSEGSTNVEAIPIDAVV